MTPESEALEVESPDGALSEVTVSYLSSWAQGRQGLFPLQGGGGGAQSTRQAGWGAGRAWRAWRGRPSNTQHCALGAGLGCLAQRGPLAQGAPWAERWTPNLLSPECAVQRWTQFCWGRKEPA